MRFCVYTDGDSDQNRMEAARFAFPIAPTLMKKTGTGRRYPLLAVLMLLALSCIPSGVGFAQDETPPPTHFVPAEDLHFYLVRPFHWDDTDWVDRYYPYGWDAHNGLATHHGVEFQNKRFTPVLAAGAGIVVFAGTDDRTLIGPQVRYYGHVVIIRHFFTTENGQAVYSLYAHLQDIAVEVGDLVEEWQKIGRVGDSGVALGSHLHFEIRVGEDPFDYDATRNPELWLRVYPRYGTLAGRVTDASGDPVYGMTLHIRRDAATYPVLTYAYTYVDESVNSDAILDENFVIGDLPRDVYEVYIRNANGKILFRQEVEIRSERVSWLEIQLSELPAPVMAGES